MEESQRIFKDKVDHQGGLRVMGYRGNVNKQVRLTSGIREMTSVRAESTLVNNVLDLLSARKGAPSAMSLLADAESSVFIDVRGEDPIVRVVYA